MIDQIHNLGFSAKGVMRFENGYIIEGDIFISEAELLKLNKENSANVRRIRLGFGLRFEYPHYCLVHFCLQEIPSIDFD